MHNYFTVLALTALTDPVASAERAAAVSTDVESTFYLALPALHLDCIADLHQWDQLRRYVTGVQLPCNNLLGQALNGYLSAGVMFCLSFIVIRVFVAAFIHGDTHAVTNGWYPAAYFFILTEILPVSLSN